MVISDTASNGANRLLIGIGLACALFAFPFSAQAQDEPASADGTAQDASEEKQEEKDWLVNEDTGKRFTVEKVPKVARAFKRQDNGRVRFPGGATFEVESENDEWFFVRVYERVMTKPVKRAEPAGPSEEEVAEVMAAYETDLETKDQLVFQDFGKGLPKFGQWRNGFDMADMNGDGHLDIVFGPARKGRPQPNIFLGDGKGEWRPWTEARFAPAPYDYGDVAVGDLDGDGNMDLVFGIHLRGLFVSRSLGDGKFEAWSEGVAIDVPGQGGDATSFSSRSVQLLDWNDDGKLDIIAFGEGPKGLKTQVDKDGNNQLINTSRGFLAYLNNGDGTWEAKLLSPRGRRANFGDDFAVTDFEGDGKWELVTVTRQLGSRAIIASQTDDGEQVEYREVDEIRDNGYVDSIEVVDLDGDKRLDILLSYRNQKLGTWRGGIDVLYAQEGGGYRRVPLLVRDGNGAFNSIGVGNLNGDGRPDLVAADSDGALHVILSEGDKFVLETSAELDQKSPGCQGFEITLIDLDGKPGDEVVVGFAGEQTGYPGIPNLSKDGCAREGSIRVWRVEPVAAPAS